MRIKIPVLHDNHNHTSLYAALTTCVDISNLNADAAMQKLVSMPSDGLHLVRGWKSYELKLGNKELAKLPPLLIVNFSLHGFVISDSALPYVKAIMPEIADKRYDSAWCESNVPLIFANYSKLSPLTTDALENYIDSLVPLGIGSSDEMTVPDLHSLEVCLKSKYKLRLNMWLAPSLYSKCSTEQRKSVSGIKLYLDGAIGSHSAAIQGAWLGEANPNFTYTDAQLLSLVEEYSAYNTGLSMHCIGDLAIEQAIKTVEQVYDNGIKFNPMRLEHIQFITTRQAERAKKLGLILSMQPNFSSDSLDYVDLLSSSYLERNNPFRMLIDDIGFVPGQDMIFGSDGMPNGIEYAMTQALFPAYKNQQLTVDELIAGYGKAQAYDGSITLDIDNDNKKVKKCDV